MPITDPDLLTVAQAVVNLQDKLNADTGQIADLTSKLGLALANQRVTSGFLRQFPDQHLLPGWILAGGTAGNTGQSGSGGNGSLAVNSDATATLSIQPAGPYYDAFWYRKLDVVPDPTASTIGYRSEWLLDSANLALCQAIEMDGSYYAGKFRFQPALQVDMHTKTLRYYDPAKPDWVTTGIPVVPIAGEWLSLEVVTRLDSAGKLTYLAAALNGAVYSLGVTVNCRAKVTTPFIETSLQLDSNSEGKPYQAEVRGVSMWWC